MTLAAGGGRQLDGAHTSTLPRLVRYSLTVALLLSSSSSTFVHSGRALPALTLAHSAPHPSPVPTLCARPCRDPLSQLIQI
eukprot:scaffold24632_cov125-Isochrysis_galbana.AAC.1